MNACLPVDPHVLGQEKNPLGTGLKAEAFSFSAFAALWKAIRILIRQSARRKSLLVGVVVFSPSASSTHASRISLQR
jgi:hypothetical protein